ncbi:type VII secretion integral membrane protein EccD [Mycolicibacterium goodii]|uniref:type VII secretion integral membrane protein EccD n=1 Tax=Mycolicibacterium goodii TaxID=134601 RepID=UPI001BDCA5FC|nr:type VII secretion integral membrane protein EccD [Mycolicibacterium goodii]MBU8833913.1 type VII secretion integral membrane protein EccD [Mycolicibacterium goodii]
MTTATERSTQGAVPARQVRLAEQVNVAVLFEGRQHDVTLPASSPVAAVVDALVRRLQTDDSGEEGLRSPDENGMVSPGLVNLTHIDGRPLDRTQTLGQQGVVDGDLLVLEVIDADVEFTPVIESPSSAVAVLNKARTPVVTAATARLVAGIIVAVAVAVTTGLLMLAWSRNRGAGQEWNLIPTAGAAGLGLLLIIGGALVWRQQRDSVTANALWLPGALIACPAAAFMAAPGSVGPWHLTFAVMVAVVLAALLWRLSPAPRALMATIVIVGTGLAALAVVHALTGATLQNLSVVVMVLALFVLTGAPKIAARMAGIPVPPFPTVTGKDTFDNADAIAKEALVAAEHQGTPSVEDLRRGAEAANVYLSALLIAVAIFFVGASVFVVEPGQGRWWLATVFIGLLAAVLLLRGRAFAARGQAITVVAASVLMVMVTTVKYALTWPSPVAAYAAAAVIIALGIAGMGAAAVVPAKVFSPVFRKIVEWCEYLLIVAVPPVAVWLLNLLALARNM